VRNRRRICHSDLQIRRLYRRYGADTAARPHCCRIHWTQNMGTAENCIRLGNYLSRWLGRGGFRCVRAVGPTWGASGSLKCRRRHPARSPCALLRPSPPFRSTDDPRYHPTTLLKVYLYGYFNSIQSSQRLERETQRRVQRRIDAANRRPDARLQDDRGFPPRQRGGDKWSKPALSTKCLRRTLPTVRSTRSRRQSRGAAEGQDATMYDRQRSAASSASG
jgi:hypothetical protein